MIQVGSAFVNKLLPPDLGDTKGAKKLSTEKKLKRGKKESEEQFVRRTERDVADELIKVKLAKKADVSALYL